MSKLPTSPVFIKKQDCSWYTSHYCEENIYRLVKFALDQQIDSVEVIFISNKNKKVPIWSQANNEVVVWDYHVIMLIKSKPPGGVLATHIYDFDSTLPFPVPLHTYVEQALKPVLDQEYARMYRVIPGALFIKFFASDRSHMKKDGAWLATPPKLKPIVSETSSNNLFKYIDMNNTHQNFGKVYSEKEFILNYLR